MNCKEARDLLIVCLTGTAPPDERRALQAHLETCAVCRDEGRALEETVAFLRTAPEPQLPEAQWTAVIAALDRRLQQDASGSWRQVVRWIRNPRIAWSAAAATSALVVALGVMLLVHPNPQTDRVALEDPAARIHGFITESIVQSLPAMAVAVDTWKAGLSAAEVPYESLPAGGE